MARARRATSARPRASGSRSRAGATAPGGRAAQAEVLGWEDDPGPPDSTLRPIARPTPTLAKAPLALAIRGAKPKAQSYTPGTRGFRYWVAAEALRRGADFWASLLPRGVSWHSTVGRQLAIGLDQGEDLNAFYDRRGLQFFHGNVAGTIVFSGESPDITCHELGHAVLDALRPQLWDAATIEAAAFHESFGDMSAILSALQLRSVREETLVATAGKLDRSSRLSRLAEQLGWAIRQIAPDAVDRDSLRNAANSFFYRDPATLPPSAPAVVLSSEPHSFSRVFTAAFLRALAGMFALAGRSTEQGLLSVSEEAGRLLVAGVRTSPVVPAYYSQVAAHVLAADAEQFGSRYGQALKAAFVRHGILSLDSAVSVAAPQAAPARRTLVAAFGDGAAHESLPRLALTGSNYGLDQDLLVDAPAQPVRFSVSGAAVDVGSVEPPAHTRAAASFVEDLFRRGRIDVGDVGGAEALTNPLARKTHDLKEEAGALVLRRRLFDCGFDCGYHCHDGKKKEEPPQ